MERERESMIYEGLDIRAKSRRLARSLRQAMPDACIETSHAISTSSSYVFIIFGGIREKIRISDHPVGRYRLLNGDETLFLDPEFKPADLLKYRRDLLRRYRDFGGTYENEALPLFPETI